MKRKTADRIGIGVSVLIVVFVAWRGSIGWQRYNLAQMRAEGPRNLRQLFDGALAYYAADHSTRFGQRVPAQFPSAASRVAAPANWHALVCPDGEPATYLPDASTFDDPVWDVLGFRPAGPLRFEYSYESWGDWRSGGFRVIARSDLDCDGIPEVVERDRMARYVDRNLGSAACGTIETE